MDGYGLDLHLRLSIAKALRNPSIYVTRLEWAAPNCEWRIPENSENVEFLTNYWTVQSGMYKIVQVQTMKFHFDHWCRKLAKVYRKTGHSACAFILFGSTERRTDRHTDKTQHVLNFTAPHYLGSSTLRMWWPMYSCQHFQRCDCSGSLLRSNLCPF